MGNNQFSHLPTIMNPTPEVKPGEPLMLLQYKQANDGYIVVAFVGGVTVLTDRSTGRVKLDSCMRGLVDIPNVYVAYNTLVFTTSDNIVSFFLPQSNRITIINVHEIDCVLFDGYVCVNEDTGLPTRTILTSDDNAKLEKPEVVIGACTITADPGVAFIGGMGFIIRVLLCPGFPPALISKNVICASITLDRRHLYVATRCQLYETGDIWGLCILKEIGTPFNYIEFKPMEEDMCVDTDIDVQRLIETRDVSDGQRAVFKPLTTTEQIVRLIVEPAMLILMTQSVVFVFPRHTMKWICVGEPGIHPNSINVRGTKLVILSIKNEKPIVITYDCITEICTQHEVPEDILVSLPYEKKHLHPDIGITTTARLQLDDEHQEGHKQVTRDVIQLVARDQRLFTFQLE
jgi:hypothetical protein